MQKFSWIHKNRKYFLYANSYSTYTVCTSWKSCHSFLAGFLYDVTHYYGNSFYLGGAMTMFGSLIMIPAKIMLMQNNVQKSVQAGKKTNEVERNIKPIPIFYVPKQYPSISIRFKSVGGRPEIIDVHRYEVVWQDTIWYGKDLGPFSW